MRFSLTPIEKYDAPPLLDADRAAVLALLENTCPRS